MIPLSVDTIAKIVGGEIISDLSEKTDDLLVQGVVTDSRKVNSGDLFVPLVGERADGHDFIAQCFEKGAVCCFTEKRLPTKHEKPLILVQSTAQALLDFAEYYLDMCHIPVVAITGSVGKTTTKDLIASVLSQKYKVLKTEGNYNTNVGLPLTVFRLSKEHELAVLEMGMNSFGEIHNLSKVAKPSIAVITNIGVSHIENLGSRDGILKAKCEVFDYMKETDIAILNGDDDKLITLRDTLPQKIIWYGVTNKEGIYAENIRTEALQSTICDVCTPVGKCTVTIPVPGEHMVKNALAAVAVGLKLHLSLEEIKNGIETFMPTKMRMDVIEYNHMTIINDSYNANPVSMKAAIDVLDWAKGRKVCIVGDMGELGSYANEMHYEVGNYIANKGIDFIISIGTLTKELDRGAREAGASQVYHYDTQEEFWEKGLDKLASGDTILVKASRSMKLEKTVDKLQGVK